MSEVFREKNRVYIRYKNALFYYQNSRILQGDISAWVIDVSRCGLVFLARVVFLRFFRYARKNMRTVCAPSQTQIKEG